MATAFRIRGLGLALLLMAASPPPAWSQNEITARGATISLGGRLHSQLATSSAEGAKSFDFFNRRARLTVDVTVNDFLEGRVQPDFGGGSLDLKDAYVRLNVDPRFRVSFGQFKRSFDVFELDSSTDMVVVERTGRIDGVGDCLGPGGLCALSGFSEGLEYSDRDVGIKVEGEVGERTSYQATLTNGTGTRGADENSGKSFAGRLSVVVARGVVLSGNLSHHDYPRDDTTGRGTAWGADLEVGGFREGTHLQIGLMGGDNWLAEDPVSGTSPTFLTGQAILSRYVPLSDGRFEAVEPLVRVSWGDPHSDLEDDAGVLFTPGVFLYVSGKNRIGANVDVYSPQGGDTEFGLKVQTYLYF